MSHQASLYYHTGSLDGISMRGNKDSFRKCRIVPRIMRNVSSVRPQTTIFGLESALPIYISPSSNAMLGHPDGELNMTRGVSLASATSYPAFLQSPCSMSPSAPTYHRMSHYHRLAGFEATDRSIIPFKPIRLQDSSPYLHHTFTTPSHAHSPSDHIARVDHV